MLFLYVSLLAKLYSVTDCTSSKVLNASASGSLSHLTKFCA